MVFLIFQAHHDDNERTDTVQLFHTQLGKFVNINFVPVHVINVNEMPVRY